MADRESIEEVARGVTATAWAASEPDLVGAAEELAVAPARADGTLRQATPIWVVRVGVAFVDADDGFNDAVDAAYREKYQRYSSCVEVAPPARATTLKLVPQGAR